MSESNRDRGLSGGDTTLDDSGGLRRPEGEPPAGPSSRVLGNYRLLQKLGEGGMGEVYEAEQVAPIRRRVALKLIKRGMDTQRVLARFDSERQALALMDHPAIARVYDAGATERGRPYFVMELVHGVPITAYCEAQRLGTRQRIQLFLQVCEGVQHAHQKGIIHRDIKPSNVLVAVQGDRPVPKIIDFGIAKATDQRLTDRTLFTELGQLIGTPEYMSPEQAETTGLDVDTRTDVYSLGVLLYELLVGELPFDPRRLRSSGLAGIQRFLLEEEAPRPSTRLSALDADTVAREAERQRTDPRSLLRLLRGDLDWITLHALEKDRTRRYGSPAELAADLQRFLDREPVVARPPTTTYKVGKFVRRHKLGVAAAALIALALVGGATAATVGMVRATRAERQASRQAEIARRVSDFLVGLFKVADPIAAHGDTITAREILDEGAQRIDAELRGEPEVQATLMTTMGQVYLNLGLYDVAVPLLDRALETRRKAPGDGGLELAETLHLLGTARMRKGEYPPAERAYQEALALRRQLLGGSHREVAAALLSFGSLRWAEGDLAAAETTLRTALDTFRAAGGDDDPQVAETFGTLGAVKWAGGDYEAAEAYFGEALEILRRLPGDQRLQTGIVENNLSLVLAQHGRYGQAEPLNREARELLRAILGDDHPFLALNASAYALVLHHKGDSEAARRAYEEALPRLRQVFGPAHPWVADCMSNYAWFLTSAGDDARAAELAREAVQVFSRTLPEGHWRTAIGKGALGAALAGLGRYGEAEPLLLESLPILESRRPEDQFTRASRKAIVDLYRRWGRPEEAAAYRAGAG